MSRLAPRFLIVLLVATLWLTPRQWVHVVGGRLVPPTAAGKDRSARGRNRVNSPHIPAPVSADARLDSGPGRPARVARRPFPPDPSPGPRRHQDSTPSRVSQTTPPLRC